MQVIENHCILLQPHEIEKYRIENNLSRSELARRMSTHIEHLTSEVNPSTIYRYEKGLSKPSPSYMRAIEKVLLYEEDDSRFTQILREEVGIITNLSVRGEWLSVWSYQKKSGQKKSNSGILKVSHDGDLILGISDNNKDFQYKIVAHLVRDNVISGIWYSILKRSSHHGVFMLKMTKNGKKADGHWTGTYDDEGSVNFMEGNWEWTRRVE